MTTTKLKQALGTDGQSLTDESSGLDGLKSVLAALARTASIRLTGSQAVVATGDLDELLISAAEAGDYDVELRLTLGTTGDGNDTDVQLQLNGTLITGLEVTVDNTDADDLQVKKTLANVTVVEGDRLTLAVTAIPTNSADLRATASLTSLLVE